MIENELKYVIALESETTVDMQCVRRYEIDQGYLPGNGRIRKLVGPSSITNVEFVYKIPLSPGVAFEIDKEITHEEFELLWPHTERRLQKRRYKYTDSIRFTAVFWDIDYFLLDGKPVFAMAEAELAEGEDKPERILPFLQPHVIYEIPREEIEKFSSSRLTSPHLLQCIAERFYG